MILVQSNSYSALFRSRYSKLIFRYLKRYVNFITVYTELDKKIFSEVYPEDKIKVIPRGCRIQTANKTRELTKRLVVVTRVDEEQKNLSELLNIIKHLPLDYTIDIYGAGSRSQVERLKQIIKAQPRISYLGPTTNVKEVLIQYSVFLMTSRTEGFGQTLIEARSQGLPCVVYDTFEAASWVVKNGETGFLIQPYDSKAFADAVLHICSNMQETYEEFSKNCICYAQETSLSEINMKWLSLMLDKKL